MNSTFQLHLSSSALVRRQAGWIFAAAATLASSLSLTGADLRTSSGERAVSRSVTVHRQAEPESAAIEPSFAAEYNEPFDDCCNGCGHACASCCQFSGGGWADFDFLLGWRHGIRFPPAVTSAVGVPAAAVAGVLNNPSTVLVYPTEAIGEQARPGGRVSAGMWLDNWQCWAAEVRYWMLDEQTTEFSLNSTGAPILARPFFDAVGNTQASLLVAYPGLNSPGNVSVTTQSELLGGDALLRKTMYRTSCGTVQLVAGYQFSRINESLVIADATTDADPTNLIADGTVFAITDNFVTHNEYHAGAIGAAARYERDCWSVDILGKVGFGNMQETVVITGLTVTTPPAGAAVTNQFGLLAQGANLGTFTQDNFSVSPELNVKFVYHVSRCVDVAAGYTFIYWTHLAQPGHQIDSRLTVPAAAFAIRDGEYWMHGLSLGASFRF